MKSEGSLDKFALSVAIGSMLLLGGFLIVDANFNGFLQEFERYATFKSWSIVAAIPAVTFAYILGAFVQVLADLIVKLFSPRVEDEEWQAFASIARANNDALTSRYDEIRRSKKLLEGNLAPLIVLACGVFAERARLPNLSCLLLIVAATVFVIALTIPFITSRLHRSLVRLGAIANHIGDLAQGSKDTG